MTVDDFFDFDESEYASRISQYTTQRLKEQEVVKIRQITSAGWTMGLNFTGAFLTAGVLLAPAAYGARRYYVAEKKVNLIRAELQKRNIELHEESTRDVLIPIASGVLGFEAANEFAINAGAHTTTDEQDPESEPPQEQAMQADPGAASTGALHGAEEQMRQMAMATTEISSGTVNGTEQVQQLLGDAVQLPPSNNAAEAAGFSAGMLLAQGVERSVVYNIIMESAWWAMEVFDSSKKANTNNSANHPQLCLRLLGLMPLICDGCDELKTSGRYWHCCDCGEHKGFDLCSKCYSSGRRCKSQNHRMGCLQIAGDVEFMPSSQDPQAYLQNTEAKFDSLSKSALVGSVVFFCNICEDGIMQGSWFHCKSCGQFDLCQTCYMQENHCPDEGHSLELRLCSLDCSANPRIVEDCQRKQTPMAQISCSECQKTIVQGRYYHCCNCNNDDFDLCHGCYKTGKRCSLPQQHKLQKHYAGRHDCVAEYPDNCIRTGRKPNSIVRNGGFCSRCKTKFSKGHFYHCCSCNNDDFDLCTSCYKSGKGCDDPEHQMTLHELDEIDGTKRFSEENVKKKLSQETRKFRAFLRS